MILELDPAGPLWLVLATLAGWRLTNLLCYEAGPLEVMVRLRRLCYRIGLRSLVDCFHCAGFWMAVLVTVLAYRPEPPAVLVALAISGGISLLENLATSGPSNEEDES